VENEKLFHEFPPVTTQQWEEKITEDLKGAGYEKTLVWNTPEGFKVNPYYREEHLKDKDYLHVFPGEYPYSRGNKIRSNHWHIRQDINVSSVEDVNEMSLHILKKGITALGFVTDPLKKNPVKSQKDFSALIKNIPFDSVALNFICGGHAPEMIRFLNTEAGERKAEKKTLSGSVDFDPLGYLTIHGKFFHDEASDLKILYQLITDAGKDLPAFRTLGIHGDFFHNAGATAVQELGYGLAIASDYLAGMADAGLDTDTGCQQIHFYYGIGSNYFMEIAKIRAARLLWAKLAEAYGAKQKRSMQTAIHSVTSGWNQTVYDPYINVLRATTESMAAIIGGTDSLVVKPFTDAYKPVTEFSARIARNIQIILKEEAYFDKVADPSGGSYYIENLTDSLIGEAWKLFLETEDQGGYLSALKKGSIQSAIATTAQNRRNAVAGSKEILLGVNHFPNQDESINNELINEIAFPVPPDKQEVTPIREFRGSSDIEKLRLATEGHPGGRPVVFILATGDQTMRRARAAFAFNFFGCAGYRIIDHPGFASPAEGVRAAQNEKADIVVLCSSDREYAELAPEVRRILPEKTLLVIAGAPECMEELKSRGIRHFIHLRSNMTDSLKTYHNYLGIKTDQNGN
jgi:methylmalonyl-CoA mutase